MKLLTIKEAAAMCRMSQGWIKLAIRKKELPCVRFGRSVRIFQEALERYARSKIEGSTQSDGGSPSTETTKAVSEKTVSYRP